jgi:hypothetical protein
MANFDWRQVSKDIHVRYDDRAIGYSAWRQLIEVLFEVLRIERFALLLEAFDTFLRQLRELGRGQAGCRVFISHQRADVLFAERIAYLASAQGFEYWLDVLDPTLQAAMRGTFPPAVQSVLIAAIIEMALLNCTHGITVQTANAQASRWVPYEFGRAKRRWLVSTQVASWFDNGIYQSTQADYLKLGICAQTERELVSWLTTESKHCGCGGIAGWVGVVPPKLPN